ncbi:MAG: bifunctional YncE family protein/alkaline phosphatase family protein [Vulcanimicrobiaceae bacterium]
MILRRLTALAAAALLLAGAATRSAAAYRPLAFSAPAGDRIAGRIGATSGAVLPSGRLARPLGVTTTFEGRARGLALSPNGRIVVVAGEAGGGGASLVAYDARNLRELGRERRAGAGGYDSVIAVADPADPSRVLLCAGAADTGRVDVFTLAAGGGMAFRSSIAIGPGPGTVLALTDHGRLLTALDSGGERLVTIDLRRLEPVGAPLALGPGATAALTAGRTLLVAERGRAAGPETPARTARLAAIPETAASGEPVDPINAVALDRLADGVQVVGGVGPSALASLPAGRSAFVALANVDRVVTIALEPSGPKVVGGTELRLYPRAPYGTEPSALALDAKGRFLYVALAGIEAVAVLDARDPRHLRRLGLLPTAARPRAVALANGDRTLLVLAAGGLGAGAPLLERIDLNHLSLKKMTRQALEQLRRAGPASADPVIPQVLGTRPSRVLSHVVVVFFGNDLPVPSPNAPAAAAADRLRAPNVAALAQRFAAASNFYTDAPARGDEERGALCGQHTLFGEPARLGCIWNVLLARGVGYRALGVLPGVPQVAQAVVLPTPAPYASIERANLVDRELDTLASEGRWPTFVAVDLAGESVSAADRTLGRLIAGLSRSPQWGSTAVFVLPGNDAATDGAAADRAPPGSRRRTALLVSPYARPAFRSGRLLTPASTLKTVEAILGLPALSLADDLASDWSSLFAQRPDSRPFVALEPVGDGSAQAGADAGAANGAASHRSLGGP